MNVKINQRGAFGIEYGGTWGEEPTNKNILKAKPYTSFGTMRSLNKEKDSSINGTAHSTGSVLTGIDVSNDIEMIDRFNGLAMFHTWAYGFEQAVKKVGVFKVNALETEPDVGATFVDSGTGNTYEFLHKSVFTAPDFTQVTTFVFEETITVAPLTGVVSTLTEEVGGDDQVISTLGSSVGARYLHTFEYANDREKRDFTAEEIANLGTFYNALDKRVLMMACAKDMGDYHKFTYNNMCKSFGWNVSSAGMVNLKYSMKGFNDVELNKSTSGIDFDQDCPSLSVTNIVNHYQTIVEVGAVGTPYGTNMVEVGATDVSIESSIPVQDLQTTKSKQHFEELWLQGKYEHTGSITIGRHINQTFIDWWKAQTPLHCRIASFNGLNAMQEIIVKKFTLNTAGADDSDVPQEALEMDIELACEPHDYSDYLGAEVYNAPIVFRLIDNDPINYSTGRDATGTKYYV